MSKVSVLMPAYNVEKYIYDAIDSILNQTYKDIELIIVDDGSTDKTVDIIRSFNDRRIKLYKNEKNMGLPYTRNRLLELANGEYIAIMDSDDISHKKRIEKQVKFLKKNNNIDVVGTNFKRFNESLSKRASVETDYRVNKVRLMFINGLQNPSVMFRTSFIKEKNIKYRDEYIVAQDYAFWIDCIKYGNVTNIKKVLLYYRTGHDSITKTSKSKKAEIRKKLLREIHERALSQANIILDEEDKEVLWNVLDDNSEIIDREELIKFNCILKKINIQIALPKKEKALQYVWQNRVIRSNLGRRNKLLLIFKYRFLIYSSEDIKSIVKVILNIK